MGVQKHIHIYVYPQRCGIRTHIHTIPEILTYLLTAIGLSPGGSSTVHIYTQYTERHKTNNT